MLGERAKQAIAIVLFGTFLSAFGMVALDASQQPPKSINENKRPAPSHYQPGKLEPLRILFSGGLQQISDYCNSYPKAEKNKWPQAYYCDFKITDVYIAIFSGLLVFVTGALGWIGIQQYRDTRILQRAYIAVEPRGIVLSIEGDSLIGRVAFVNAGNLPAGQLSWLIDMSFTQNGEEKSFPISKPAKGSIIIAPKAIAVRGAEHRLPLQKISEAAGNNFGKAIEITQYIYVWGVVRYLDGFRRQRKTLFCHRYNWKMRGEGGARNYEIGADYARYHTSGNDAD